MEFWGIEVKPGETVNIEPDDDRVLHLSQASLGGLKGKENVVIYVKVDGQKLVIGTLSSEKCAQIPFDLVFEKEFELWHTSKSTSISFVGYKAPMQGGESDPEDYPENESVPEEVPVGQNANGKAVVKQDQGKSGAGKATVVKEDNSSAKKAKKTEPVKIDKPKAEDDDDEDEDDDDDSEESEDDEDLAEAMSDSDDEDEDESSAEEDEAAPKKVETGKRPATDSASKTPAPEKKAKVSTPAGQKTGGDGKKHVHVATPYPAKQAVKTPGNSDKSKQQTPKSAGSVVCKSCSRTFNSDNALQAHTKAKHG